MNSSDAYTGELGRRNAICFARGVEKLTSKQELKEITTNAVEGTRVYMDQHRITPGHDMYDYYSEYMKTLQEIADTGAIP
jgi:hypothetical protein